MNSKTEELINALGIKQIYWIDDKFFDGKKYTEAALQQAIVETIGKGEPLPNEINNFSKYLGNQIDEGILAQDVMNFIRELESSGKQNEIEGIHAALSKIGAFGEEDALSDEGFEQLKALFGRPVLSPMSFSVWEKEKKTLDLDEKTLCLIDYENKIDTDAAGLSGKDVLSFLSSLKSQPFSIVLTHVCQPDEESTKAAEIFQEITKEPGESIRRFSLMSKQRIQASADQSRDDLIAPPFKRLAINQMYRRIAETCITSMHAGLDEGINKLNELPVEDIDHAIFARSSEEGISEPEVINRILGISQRSHFFRSVAESVNDMEKNFFKDLRTLRDVKHIRTKSDTHYKVHSALEDLRVAELMDEGSFINPICSPLTCGDVFQKWSGGEYRGATYIFLGSPCDLMVRDNGTRIANEGIFAAIKWETLDEADAHRTEAGVLETTVSEREKETKNAGSVKKFEIAVGTSKGKLLVDFHKATTVNLKALDFCVSNVNGEVKFSQNCRLPHVLLSGWRKRFEHVKTSCEQNGAAFPDQYKTLCMFNEDFSGMRVATENGNEINFKLKRQYRIRSPYAEAILNAYLQSINRPAFDHSFAEQR